MTIRTQEEKTDARIKAWRRLPKIQQNVILLGGVEENGTIPEEPTEEMFSILGCQNGAQVDQYLRQSMPGYNVSFEPGFCTAINKGMLISPNDTATPKNFTPFFTPPMKDDVEEEQNANLLKLAVQEKYDNRDLELLTKMEVTIPMCPQELRHHVRNITAVAGRCMGEHSLIYESLSKLEKHVQDMEMSYQYEFRQDPLFGGNFLDLMNWQMHRFLESCASGEESRIDTSLLDFSEMMHQVERRQFPTKSPAWITRLMKKREAQKDLHRNTKTGGGWGGDTNRGTKRRQFTPKDSSKRVFNGKDVSAYKLKQNEQFRDMFHPGNIKGVTKPARNGDMFCLRYHTLGFCYPDCKYKSGHCVLTPEEEGKFTEFMKEARSNLQNYNKNRKTNPNYKGGDTNKNEDGKKSGESSNKE